MTDRYVPVEDIEVYIQEAFEKGKKLGERMGAHVRTLEIVMWLRKGKAAEALFGQQATDGDYDDMEALADLVEELWDDDNDVDNVDKEACDALEAKLAEMTRDGLTLIGDKAVLHSKIAILYEAMRATQPFVHRFIVKCPEEATPAVLLAETNMVKALDAARTWSTISLIKEPECTGHLVHNELIYCPKHDR